MAFLALESPLRSMQTPISQWRPLPTTRYTAGGASELSPAKKLPTTERKHQKAAHAPSNDLLGLTSLPDYKGIRVSAK